MASDIPAILPYTRKMIFLEDGEMAVIQEKSFQISTLAGRRAAAGRPKRFSGTRSRPRRAGTNILCSRRSSSSPGPSRTRSADAFPWKKGRFSWRSPGSSAQSPEGDSAGGHHRLRDFLPCRPGGKIHDRRAGPHSGGGGSGLGIPLPRSPRGTPGSPGGHFPVGGNDGHPGRLSGREEKREPGPWPSATWWTAAWPGNPKGLFYTHAGPEIGVASTKAFTCQLVGLFLLAINLARTRETLAHQEAKDLLENLTQDSPPAPGGPGSQSPGRSPRQKIHERPGFPLPGPGRQLPHRPGRGAEAEGNLVHSRRRISGRGDEARPDRPDRRGNAGRGPGAQGQDL